MIAECDTGALVVPRCNSHSAGGRKEPTMLMSIRCLRSEGRTDTPRSEFAPFPSAKKKKVKKLIHSDFALAVSYVVITPFT